MSASSGVLLPLVGVNTVRLVKRDRRRFREFAVFAKCLYLRHDEFEKQLAEMTQVARRAEQVASKTAQS